MLIPSDEAAWVHDVISRHGFVKGEIAEIGWCYDLSEVPEPFEPEGFVVDSVRVPEDYAGIDRCLEGDFGGNKSRIPILMSLATNPMFRPELSVVARASNGDIAAYCRGTVNPEAGVGSIDPVATRPDYQRLGLGKAVVLRCFAQQRQLRGRNELHRVGTRGLGRKPPLSTAEPSVHYVVL